MRALVTGGGGFIGSHLVELLVERGHSVRVLDNFSTGSIDNLTSVIDRIEMVIGSTGDATVVNSSLDGIDQVFHLAASVGVELVSSDPVAHMWDNVRGVETVLAAAQRCGAGVLFASSSEVYGCADTFPMVESADRVLGPTTESRWGYAASKALGEMLLIGRAQNDGMRATVARLFNTVGPRQLGEHGMVLPRFVRWALTGDPLEVIGDGSQTRSFCYVDDLARGIVALLDSDVHLPVNLGSTDEHTVLGIARLILRLTGSDSGLEFVDRPENDPSRRRPDLTRAADLLGWEPTVPVEEGMGRTVAAIAGQLGAAVAAAEVTGP
jgi:UDP-glucose 4-epimerase